MAGYDQATVASLYSQLTGVLAGFAFAALFFLIGSMPSREAEPGERSRHAAATQEPLPLLLSAFLGLVLTSVSYAVVAGERTEARASLEHVVAGTAFASAASLLLVSLLRLLEGVVDEGLAVQLQRLIGVVMPLLISVSLAAGAVDLRRYYEEDLLLVPPLVFVAGTTAAALCWPGIPRRRRKPASRASEQDARLALAGLLVPFACAVAVTVLSVGPQITRSSGVGLIVASALLTMLVINAMVIRAVGADVPRPRPPHWRQRRPDA